MCNACQGKTGAGIMVPKVISSPSMHNLLYLQLHLSKTLTTLWASIWNLFLRLLVKMTSDLGDVASEWVETAWKPLLVQKLPHTNGHLKWYLTHWFFLLDHCQVDLSNLIGRMCILLEDTRTIHHTIMSAALKLHRWSPCPRASCKQETSLHRRDLVELSPLHKFLCGLNLQ